MRRRPFRGDGRPVRGVVAHGHRRVRVQVAHDLLGHEREHGRGRMPLRDARGHSAQRLLLLKPGAQDALEALILDRKLLAIRLPRADNPVVHRPILPRMPGAEKPRSPSLVATDGIVQRGSTHD